MEDSDHFQHPLCLGLIQSRHSLDVPLSLGFHRLWGLNRNYPGLDSHFH